MKKIEENRIIDIRHFDNRFPLYYSLLRSVEVFHFKGKVVKSKVLNSKRLLVGFRIKKISNHNDAF